LGPMKFGVDYAHNTGNQHYRRRKWNSGIKSFVEKEMPCKTRHRLRPRTNTTPENIAAVRDLIEGDRRLTVVEICQKLGISYGSVESIIKNELQFRKFRPDGYPGCWVINKKALTKEKLAQLYLTALQHPPYNPDLSPCDYHMFGPLKEALGAAFRRWWAGPEFRAQLATDASSFILRRRIKNLPILWKKCIEKGGNYVDKWEFFYFVKLYL